MQRLDKATLDMFADRRCTVALLKAFCVVRTRTHLKDQGQIKLPTQRGNLIKAQAGDACLLLTAFGLRSQKIRLQPPKGSASRMGASTHKDAQVTQSDEHYLWQQPKSNIMSSQLLEDDEWIYSVSLTLYCNVADSTYSVSRVEMDDEVTMPASMRRVERPQGAADLLTEHCWQRLPKMLARRLIHRQDKLEHDVWKWVALCVPHVCGMIVRAGHSLPYQDLQCAKIDDSLLSADTSKFIPVEADSGYAQLQGCYLYYHESKFKWVRSGKVCGLSTFIRRHEEHTSNSKAPSIDPRSSHFYQQYPHPQSPDAQKETRAGVFTDLRQYVGIGFNRQDAELLTLDRAQGGVLEWPANIIDMVNKSGLGPRGATLAEKKLEMAAYLFELVYDLMIADRDNVSGNPGFEALIGYYGEDK